MTFLENLGWWGVALTAAIALAALAIMLVALLGGLRQARAATADEPREPTDPDAESVSDGTGGDEAAAPATPGPARSDGAVVTDPVQELKLRYARGEVDREEYLQRRADLEGQ